MCQTPDWSVGDRYLRENALELAPLVEKILSLSFVSQGEGGSISLFS